MPITIKVQEDPSYGLVAKVGSIDLEYGVKDAELARELIIAAERFVRAMEQRGYHLYKAPGLDNPKWTTDGQGQMAPQYAIDWEQRRKPRIGPDGEPLPLERETSLEDSQGMVEYRIAGIFWAPKVSIPVLKPRQEILDEERVRKNPVTFGYGDSPIPLTPLLTSDERKKEYNDAEG